MRKLYKPGLTIE